MGFSRRGFSLIEVTVAMAILTGLLAVGTSLSSRSFAEVARNRRLSFLQKEHMAMRNSVFSIRERDALDVQCFPHPYRRFNGTACVVDRIAAAPNAGRMAAINNLRRVVFRWPTAGRLDQGQSVTRLDEDYFNAQVRPALQAAGCISCHNGSALPGAAPDVNGRNFANYSQIRQLNGVTTGVTPVASRAMVNSRLGVKLLSQNFSLGGILAGSAGITHTVSFRPTVLSITESVRRGPLVQEGINDPSIGICPGPCNPGEISEPTTCVVQSGIVCNPCAKKKCMGCHMGYRRTWNCIRYQEFSRTEVNATVNSVGTELFNGAVKGRFISTEGTLH